MSDKSRPMRVPKNFFDEIKEIMEDRRRNGIDDTFNPRKAVHSSDVLGSIPRHRNWEKIKEDLMRVPRERLLEEKDE